MTNKRSWGIVDKLPSGNWRARYTHNGKRYKAPTTFKTKGAADAYLARTRTEIESGKWLSPEQRQQAEAQEQAKRVKFGEYAQAWVEQRTNASGEALRPSTKAEYTRIITTGMLAYWSNYYLQDITPAEVRSWYTEMISTGKKTMLGRSYDLMKSILKTAVDDDSIPTNPCKVVGGSQLKTGKKVEPPTDEELDIILEALPEKYKAFAIVAASTGLRMGEIVALTGNDITILESEDGEVYGVVIDVNKAVTEIKTTGRAESNDPKTKSTKRVVGKPKTEAGVRIVEVFGKDAKAIASYVARKDKDQWLWANHDGTGPMPQATFQTPWRKAREKAGRPDLHFHALRHYQGTRYAQSGATVKETMARLGHNDIKAAMRYQHAGSRSEELARRAART